jgi:hypothetical protein
MSLSRRKFLRAGTLVAISAGLPLRTLVAETLSQPSSTLPTNNHLNAGLHLNRETFSRYLNTKFSFSHEAVEAVALKLIEVNDLTPKMARRSAANGKECFAAVFIGSHNAPMRQETYMVTHESIGKFAMFVVPIGRNKEGIYYEAVFNRLH